MKNTPELQSFINKILLGIKVMRSLIKEAKNSQKIGVTAWDTRETIIRRQTKLRQRISIARQFKESTELKMFRQPYRSK